MALNAAGRGLRLPVSRMGQALTIASVSATNSAFTYSTKTPASRRAISSSEKRPATSMIEPVAETILPPVGESLPRAAPLSILPLTNIIRSLITNTISSSHTLLPPSMRIMAMLANSTNPILSPDRNPLLGLFMKYTFYAQFCAGEKPSEVRQTINGLKDIGFNGVILCYAKEVVLSEDQIKSLSGAKGQETTHNIENELKPWAEGTLETVRLASPGDYVALKFTGAGSLALYQLQNRLPASPYLANSIDSICKLACERGVRLLFDAEQDALQLGIDDWTIEYARKYNTEAHDAVIYGTYQAYKKNCPQIISEHLAIAQKEGWTLGVKLVRGAYLGSDPRHLLHDTKADTDACFDAIAESVLTREWTNAVKGEGAYPNTAMVLATHNADSVRRARAIADAGLAKAYISCAQLQGMADEVSCEIVDSKSPTGSVGASVQLPVYKYLVWGSIGECMKYLLRRAQENKDAVQRTRSTRDAMFGELVRRCKAVVGLV
ncbi:unnamed protein product [Clonostachys solani]|uniref:Proline dehydrogenase n=1 Tax=Clonostachys solani TaxID=160281 RepID=A0A9N9ZM20_9HYPO|nr:unnamed protein product [Clonostachys solani]